jgi:lysylphosphatidylglycerol synthetase-like protein (DUF2156 family)
MDAMDAKVTSATATHQELHRVANPLYPITSAMFLGFGTTLLIISMAYARDLATLARVPEAVWLFVCGVPTEDPMVLPLMISLSVVALVVGGGLVFWSRRGKAGSR